MKIALIQPKTHPKQFEQGVAVVEAGGRRIRHLGGGKEIKIRN